MRGGGSSHAPGLRSWPPRAGRIAPGCESQALDRAAQLVRGDVCVALRRVEVLVAEQLLDLAQVRTGAQQLGRKNVPERMRSYPLAVRHTGGARVAEEGLGHDRLR